MYQKLYIEPWRLVSCMLALQDSKPSCLADLSSPSSICCCSMRSSMQPPRTRALELYAVVAGQTSGLLQPLFITVDVMLPPHGSGIGSMGCQ